MSTETSPDIIDTLAGLLPGTEAHQARHQRAKVAAATQGSDDALFDPALPGLTLAERLHVAAEIARTADAHAVLAHYEARLAPGGPVTASPRLEAMSRFARTLTLRPVEADRVALLALRDAGLGVPEIVALAQLIAYVSYQLRLVAGFAALVAGSDPAAPTHAGEGAEPFVHPANLPPPGEPLRLNGFTSETLGWKAWLDVLDPATATREQLAVLDASHPKARSSDYYLLLAHQPRILDQRSQAFNAIMYAPGGLSRAERELASTVASCFNGCVYCASVHAQRFEQLAKRNDVIAQVFTDPATAGTNARERAIATFSIALTRAPGALTAHDLHPLREAGLTDLEVVDLIHAVAIFAWANRLMLNLGEPVFPQK